MSLSMIYNKGWVSQKKYVLQWRMPQRQPCWTWMSILSSWVAIFDSSSHLDNLMVILTHFCSHLWYFGSHRRYFVSQLEFQWPCWNFQPFWFLLRPSLFFMRHCSLSTVCMKSQVMWYLLFEEIYELLLWWVHLIFYCLLFVLRGYLLRLPYAWLCCVYLYTVKVTLLLSYTCCEYLLGILEVYLLKVDCTCGQM